MGIVHIIDLQSVLAPTTMDNFQIAKTDNNLNKFNIEILLAPLC